MLIVIECISFHLNLFLSDFIEIDFLQKLQRHTKLDVLSLLHKTCHIITVIFMKM